MLSSGLHKNQACMYYTDIYAGKTPTHIKWVPKKLFKASENKFMLPILTHVSSTWDRIEEFLCT